MIIQNIYKINCDSCKSIPDNFEIDNDNKSIKINCASCKACMVEISKETKAKDYETDDSIPSLMSSLRKIQIKIENKKKR
ncbi:hypothetical protein ACI6Q2_13610 [Chitinophagaceae bacterium LWZ2-11]